MEFLQTLVTLPAPLHAAILAGVTLAFGFVLVQVARLSPALARFLGQYIEEVSILVAGSIVTWINSYLAQIPANWEGVGFAVLQLVVAVLAALGLVTQYRKARAVRATRGVLAGH
jgi:uncharacterized membrane protein